MWPCAIATLTAADGSLGFAVACCGRSLSAVNDLRNQRDWTAHTGGKCTYSTGFRIVPGDVNASKVEVVQRCPTRAVWQPFRPVASSLENTPITSIQESLHELTCWLLTHTQWPRLLEPRGQSAVYWYCTRQSWIRGLSCTVSQESSYSCPDISLKDSQRCCLRTLARSRDHQAVAPKTKAPAR